MSSPLTIASGTLAIFTLAIRTVRLIWTVQPWQGISNLDRIGLKQRDICSGKYCHHHMMVCILIFMPNILEELDVICIDICEAICCELHARNMAAILPLRECEVNLI